MGIERQFGKRKTPPEDPHTTHVKGKLNEYRDITEKVNEKSAVVPKNEQRRQLLEQELASIERVYDAVRTNSENPDFSSLPEEVEEQIGDISSHTRPEIEAILKNAITIRSEEAKKLFESIREVGALSKKRDALGRKAIYEETEEE